MAATNTGASAANRSKTWWARRTPPRHGHAGLGDLPDGAVQLLDEVPVVAVGRRPVQRDPADPVLDAGGHRHRRSSHASPPTTEDFGSVYSSSASRPCSRPKPLCLVPPKGSSS